MTKQKKQRFAGIVYSTDDSFEYQSEEDQVELETLENHKQRLIIQLDKKARKGKAVTLVKGFVGTDSDLEALGKLLKQKCAVGGSTKDGEVIIQGDFRDKLGRFLQQVGYQVKVLK